MEDPLNRESAPIHRQQSVTKSETEKLESVIQGMFPLWLAAMSWAEHGRAADLDRIRNYYNGRDNPMTSDDIHLMFSLIPERGQRRKR